MRLWLHLFLIARILAYWRWGYKPKNLNVFNKTLRKLRVTVKSESCVYLLLKLHEVRL